MRYLLLESIIEKSYDVVSNYGWQRKDTTFYTKISLPFQRKVSSDVLLFFISKQKNQSSEHLLSLHVPCLLILTIKIKLVYWSLKKEPK